MRPRDTQHPVPVIWPSEEEPKLPYQAMPWGYVFAGDAVAFPWEPEKESKSCLPTY